jgi:hypothetical protein
VKALSILSFVLFVAQVAFAQDAVPAGDATRVNVALSDRERAALVGCKTCDEGAETLARQLLGLPRADAINCLVHIAECERRYPEVPAALDQIVATGLLPDAGSAALPSRSDATLSLPGTASIGVIDTGPSIATADRATVLRDALRKELLVSVLESDSDTTTAASGGSGPTGAVNPFVHEDDEGGTVPTSQDPNNAPPDPNNPPAPPPEPAGESPSVGRVIVTAITDAWDRGWGPVSGVVAGVYDWLSGKPIVVRDEDPNAPVYVEPSPQLLAAVPQLIGKGIVTPSNSDPAESKSVSSVQGPDAASHINPQAVTGAQLQAKLGKGGVNPNVVDPADAASTLPGPSGAAVAGCRAGNGAPSACR